MPVRKPNESAIRPVISGKIAPPMIPEHRIPANAPWYSSTEFSASDMMIGHITDANNPTQGNASLETDAGAKSATERHASAPIPKAARIRRLSKNFSRIMPAKQPIVISPQNQPTADAPVVCGSKPWYFHRNSDIQLAVPCSEPTYK